MYMREKASASRYREDCNALVGLVVDHKLLSPEEIQERYESSVKAWQGFCPSEPYDFLASTQKRGHVPYQQKSGYDIAGTEEYLNGRCICFYFRRRAETA